MQGSLTATMDESKRHRVDEHMKDKEHDNFGRKAWLQSDKNIARVGDNMPEGAQFTECKAISGSVSDIFRGAIDMSGGTGGAAHLTESRTDGQKEQGESVRRIRREHG